MLTAFLKHTIFHVLTLNIQINNSIGTVLFRNPFVYSMNPGIRYIDLQCSYVCICVCIYIYVCTCLWVDIYCMHANDTHQWTEVKQLGPCTVLNVGASFAHKYWGSDKQTQGTAVLIPNLHVFLIIQ